MLYSYTHMATVGVKLSNVNCAGTVHCVGVAAVLLYSSLMTSL